MNNFNSCIWSAYVRRTNHLSIEHIRVVCVIDSSGLSKIIIHQFRKQSETRRNHWLRRSTISAISLMNEYCARAITAEQIKWILSTFYTPIGNGGRFQRPTDPQPRPFKYFNSIFSCFRSGIFTNLEKLAHFFTHSDIMFCESPRHQKRKTLEVCLRPCHPNGNAF